MSAMAFGITGVTIVCSIVCSGADQRKYQSSASLALVKAHWWPVDSSHKGPITRKMFPFDGVIMTWDITPRSDINNCICLSGCLSSVPPEKRNLHNSSSANETEMSSFWRNFATDCTESCHEDIGHCPCSHWLFPATATSLNIYCTKHNVVVICEVHSNFIPHCQMPHF